MKYKDHIDADHPNYLTRDQADMLRLAVRDLSDDIEGMDYSQQVVGRALEHYWTSLFEIATYLDQVMLHPAPDDSEGFVLVPVELAERYGLVNGGKDETGMYDRLHYNEGVYYDPEQTVS